MNSFTFITCDGCGASVRAPCGHPEMLAPLAVSSGWTLAFPYGVATVPPLDICPVCRVARAADPQRATPVLRATQAIDEDPLAPPGRALCCDCQQNVPEGFLFPAGGTDRICIDCQRARDESAAAL